MNFSVDVVKVVIVDFVAGCGGFAVKRLINRFAGFGRFLFVGKSVEKFLILKKN